MPYIELIFALLALAAGSFIGHAIGYGKGLRVGASRGRQTEESGNDPS